MTWTKVRPADAVRWTREEEETWSASQFWKAEKQIRWAADSWVATRDAYREQVSVIESLIYVSFLWNILHFLDPSDVGAKVCDHTGGQGCQVANDGVTEAESKGAWQI